MNTILHRSIAFLALSIIVAGGSAGAAVHAGASAATLATITALAGGLVGTATSTVIQCVLEMRHQASGRRMSTLITDNLKAHPVATTRFRTPVARPRPPMADNDVTQAIAA